MMLICQIKITWNSGIHRGFYYMLYMFLLAVSKKIIIINQKTYNKKLYVINKYGFHF